MTKANITQYSATANSNTDIDDINIDENCPASGLNNALRSLMAHLKNVDTGSQALTALSVTGAVDLNSTLNVQGETTLQTHLNMGDGDIIKLGDSADLQIYHGGSNSYIQDTGTGQLRIDTNGTDVRITKTDSEYMGKFIADGAVELYHNNSAKIATASTGVNISGGIGLGGTGSANILDDYEEGTWTPAFQTAPSGGSISSLAGQYTKIGRLVYVQVQVAGSSIAIGSYARIQGLPFAATDDADTGTYILGSIATRGHGWTIITSGTTQWYFSTSGTVSSNSTMSASAVYRTDV